MPTINNEFHIAFALRDEYGTYYINTYIAILSILYNTNSKIHIHIIHDETIYSSKNYFQELGKKYGQNIYFHHITDDAKKILDSVITSYNKATFYRFFIHEFVDVDYIIYLDSDIIVDLDICELYNIKLQDKLFGAIIDRGHWDKNGKPYKSHLDIIDFFSLKKEFYFNAGVAIINLKRCRELSKNGNIFMLLTQESIQNKIIMPCPDQDIINSICIRTGNSFLPLDEKYNFMLFIKDRMYYSLDKLQRHIVHYARRSPWDSFFPAHLLFWKYHALSPWKDDTWNCINTVMQGTGMNFLKNYIAHSGRRRQLNDFAEGGLPLMLTRALWRRFK